MANTTRTVMFLNAHLFRGSMVGALWDLEWTDKLRVKGIAEYARTSGADVVALAGVWSDDVCRHIAEACADNLPFCWWPPKKLLSVRSGPGVMFLSKKPISTPVFEAFGWLSGKDMLLRKGAAVVAIDGVSYVVADLQSGRNPSAADARWSNIEHLSCAIQRARELSDSGRVVVLGTFNIFEPPDPAEHSREFDALGLVMSDWGFTDSFRVLFPDRAHCPGATVDETSNLLARKWAKSMDCPRRPVRPDYVFVPNGVRVSQFRIEQGWKVVDEVAPEGDCWRKLDVSSHFPITVSFD